MDIKTGRISFSDWKKNSISQQENISNCLCQSIWDEFDIHNDEIYLFQKIATSIFGNALKQQDDLGLPDEKKALVNDILRKCVIHSSHKEKIRIAFIFVFIYRNEEAQTCVPLIRVMSKTPKQSVKDTPNNVFVDHLGRVYENFNHYKETNTWDKSWLCIPKFGYYTSDLEVSILNQSSRGKVVQAIDKVSTVTSIASSCVMLGGAVMCFFPPTAPIGMTLVTASSITGAPSAVYGVGRSVGSIVDRKIHEQNIGLKDAEARQCWLTVATGIVAVGTITSARFLANSARAGKLVSTSTRAFCTGLNVGSVSLSGISVLNAAFEMSKKDEVTNLEIFQFCTSILFFTHSVVSFKTASTIIKEAQRSEIMEMRKGVSPEHQEKYDAYLQGAKESFAEEFLKNKKPSEMKGQAKFIREMKKIDNLNDFYNHFEIDRSGQFYINKELTIHPRAFVQLSESDKNKLLRLSKQLNEKTINIDDFNKSMKKLIKTGGIRADQHRAAAQEYLKEKFNVDNLSDIKVGNEVLREPKPHEIDRLENVVKHSFHDGDKDYLKVVEKMAEKMNANNIDDYCAAGEYIGRKVDLEVKNRMKQNPNPPRDGGKAKEFYKTQIVNELMADDAKFNQIVDSFSDLCVDCEQQNVGNPKFNSPMTAANHYDKHPYFPKVDPRNNLSSKQYFDIAQKMAKGPISDVKWTQDGSTLRCTFLSKDFEAMCITYQNLSDGKVVIATLYAKDDVEECLMFNADSVE